MSRQIKFRAWDDKNKKWLLGYDYLNLGGFSLDGECVIMGEWASVVTSFMFGNDGKKWTDLKVMQYTGLKDRNGKEIYEGDILKFHQFLFDGFGEVEREFISELCYKDGSIWLQSDKEDNCGFLETFYGQHEESFEVIGNKYENKELLKK